jgi:phosphoribosylformylglycinamidine synthase subunit PurS
MKAKIEVMLKKGVFDPQGKVLVNALHHLEYNDVSGVKVGKLFFVEINENDKNVAKKRLAEMADQLFANPIIENFEIELVD